MEEETTKLKNKIKILEKELNLASIMITELQDENALLWEYLEELKRAEQMEIKEIEKKYMEELFKNLKNIGDT